MGTIKTITTAILLLFTGTAFSQDILSNTKCFVQMVVSNNRNFEADKPLITFKSDIQKHPCLQDKAYQELYKLDFALQFFKHLYEKYPNEIQYMNQTGLDRSRYMEESEEALKKRIKNTFGFAADPNDGRYQVIEVLDFKYQPMMFVASADYKNGKAVARKNPDPKKEALYKKWMELLLTTKNKKK